MLKRDLFRFAAATLALAPAILAPDANAAAPASAPARRTGYATVNGLRSYYEIHGSGRPLVLLHGGLMTIDTMQPLLGLLAQQRQVIAVELEGRAGRALRLENELVDICRVEMKYPSFAVIDPDHGMIVIFHGILLKWRHSSALRSRASIRRSRRDRVSTDRI